MDGHDRGLREFHGERVAAIFRDAHLGTQQRLRGDRAETHDDARANHRDLRLEPRDASADLLRVRLLVDAALASAHELEMLYDVRDVDIVPVDAGFREGFMEQPPGRADERLAGPVLGVAGLLPDEDVPEGPGSIGLRSASRSGRCRWWLSPAS
jgi:hypothetical protein